MTDYPRVGIPPATAKAQLQRDHTGVSISQTFEPLPPAVHPHPYRIALSEITPHDGTAISLHVIADIGGVKDPTPQTAVAQALIADHAKSPVAACFAVGDVVYFNGAEGEYVPQFFEPYAHYNVPILSVPGNHDGDPEEDGESSLQAWMQNFSATSPAPPAGAEEYQRDTLPLPYCYYTTNSEAATIIGLYSNVPEGGSIEPDQVTWLIEELKAASTGLPLIVALHHPPYSCDAHHGGSERMGKLLDEAFNQAQRWPDLVLSGHVHSYQRFTRKCNDVNGRYVKDVPYIVIGNGGYHNLHAMASGAVAGEAVNEEVTLDAFCADEWGFLRLDLSATQIKGTFQSVSKEGVVGTQTDGFTVPVG